MLSLSLVVEDAGLDGGRAEQSVGVHIGSGGRCDGESSQVHEVVVDSEELSVVQVEGAEEENSGASVHEGGLLGVGDKTGVLGIESVRVLLHCY